MLKKSSPSRPTKPASTKPRVISFHSICQSPRKLWATSDQADGARHPLAQRQLLADRVVLVAGVGLLRVAAGRLLEPGRDEEAQQERHERDHHEAADVLRPARTASRSAPTGRARAPTRGSSTRTGRRASTRRTRPSGRATCRSRPPRRSTTTTRRPRPVAHSERARAVAWRARLDARRGTHACTIAEIAKPEHERPPHRPRHQEGVLHGDADLRDHVRHSARRRARPRSACALPGQRVHRHLAVPARAHDALRLERLHVVGDEVLRPLRDPREVAHAQLVTVPEGERQREAGRLAQRAVAAGEALGVVERRAGGPQAVALGRVDVQQLSEHATY